MGLLTTCPSCGLESGEIRCPRCFTLKVVACGASCASCATAGKSGCGEGDGRPTRQRKAEAGRPKVSPER